MDGGGESEPTRLPAGRGCCKTQHTKQRKRFQNRSGNAFRCAFEQVRANPCSTGRKRMHAACRDAREREWKTSIGASDPQLQILQRVMRLLSPAAARSTPDRRCVRLVDSQAMPDCWCGSRCCDSLQLCILSHSRATSVIVLQPLFVLPVGTLVRIPQQQ